MEIALIVPLAALGGFASGLLSDHLARAYIEERGLLARAPRPDMAARRGQLGSALALAGAAVVGALTGGRGPELAATIALCAILATIGRIDWERRLIFPQLLALGHLAAASLALAGLRVVPGWREQATWALGCGTAYGALRALATLIARRREPDCPPPLGVGDVALAALIGAILGTRAPGALVAGQFLAGAAGATLIARRRRALRRAEQRRTADKWHYGHTTSDRGIAAATESVPLGTYLCLGAIIWLCWR